MALFGKSVRKVPFLVAQADSGGYVEATDSRHQIPHGSPL